MADIEFMSHLLSDGSPDVDPLLKAGARYGPSHATLLTGQDSTISAGGMYGYPDIKYKTMGDRLQQFLSQDVVDWFWEHQMLAPQFKTKKDYEAYFDTPVEGNQITANASLLHFRGPEAVDRMYRHEYSHAGAQALRDSIPEEEWPEALDSHKREEYAISSRDDKDLGFRGIPDSAMEQAKKDLTTMRDLAGKYLAETGPPVTQLGKQDVYAGFGGWLRGWLDD